MSVLTVIAALLGSAAVGMATILYFLSFLPGDVGVGSDEFLPFFVLAFPLWAGMFYALHGRATLRTRRPHTLDLSGTWQSQRQLFDLMPRVAKLVVPVTVVLAAVGFGTAFSKLAGQPEHHPSGHHYWVDNHGSLIAVSRNTYLHDLALQSRLFLGMSLLFLSIATMMAIGEWSRRKELREELVLRWGGSERWPRPSAPRPRTVMASGAFLSVLALSCLGLGLGGGMLLARLNNYFSGARLLPDDESVRLSLPAAHYVVYLRCPGAVCVSVSPRMLSVASSAGAGIGVTADPSSDRLSLQDETYEGVFSISIHRPGTYLFTLRAPTGLRMVLDMSNGEEAFALLPWIGSVAVGFLLLIWVLIDLLSWFRWRYRIGELLPPLTSELPRSWSGG